MKVLYYNPMEIPQGIHVIAKGLGLDDIYMLDDSHDLPFDMHSLFHLAKSDFFEDVLVLLTSHNGAYTKPSKKSSEKTPVAGWISLKHLLNGGGYLEDPVQ